MRLITRKSTPISSTLAIVASTLVRKNSQHLHQINSKLFIKKRLVFFITPPGRTLVISTFSVFHNHNYSSWLVFLKSNKNNYEPSSYGGSVPKNYTLSTKIEGQMKIWVTTVISKIVAKLTLLLWDISRCTMIPKLVIYGTYWSCYFQGHGQTDIKIVKYQLIVLRAPDWE